MYSVLLSNHLINSVDKLINSVNQSVNAREEQERKWAEQFASATPRSHARLFWRPRKRFSHARDMPARASIPSERKRATTKVSSSTTLGIKRGCTGRSW